MTTPPTNNPAEPVRAETMEALRGELTRMKGWALWVIDMAPTDQWPTDTGPAEWSETFASSLLAHLQWLAELEAGGVLVMSGPLDLDAGLGPGMSIIRADNRDTAQTIASSEPFGRAGLRTNTVRSWTVNEGSLTVRVDLMANVVHV